MRLRSIKALTRQRKTTMQLLRKPPRQTDDVEEAEIDAVVRECLRQTVADLDAEIAERTGATVQTESGAGT